MIFSMMETCGGVRVCYAIFPRKMSCSVEDRKNIPCRCHCVFFIREKECSVSPNPRPLCHIVVNNDLSVAALRREMCGCGFQSHEDGRVSTGTPGAWSVCDVLLSAAERAFTSVFSLSLPQDGWERCSSWLIDGRRDHVLLYPSSFYSRQTFYSRLHCIVPHTVEVRRGRSGV